METQKNDIKMTSSQEAPLSLTDPLVIGAGALFLGIVIGSGRLQWVGRGLGQIAESLGSLALLHLTQALKENNPEMFGSKGRVTH